MEFIWGIGCRSKSVFFILHYNHPYLLNNIHFLEGKKKDGVVDAFNVKWSTLNTWRSQKESSLPAEGTVWDKRI